MFIAKNEKSDAIFYIYFLYQEQKENGLSQTTGSVIAKLQET